MTLARKSYDEAVQSGGAAGIASAKATLSTLADVEAEYRGMLAMRDDYQRDVAVSAQLRADEAALMSGKRAGCSSLKSGRRSAWRMKPTRSRVGSSRTFWMPGNSAISG